MVITRQKHPSFTNPGPGVYVTPSINAPESQRLTQSGMVHGTHRFSAVKLRDRILVPRHAARSSTPPTRRGAVGIGNRAERKLRLTAREP
jgi:hypothetical protein